MNKDSFVLIGAPDDRGVQIVGGRVGAKGGPSAVRREFYRLKNSPPVVDQGNIQLSASQEKTYQTLSRNVQKILEAGSFPIVIGGGHDLSFGGVSGFLNCYPNGALLNIDPHFDCRPIGSDGRCSSGSAIRLLFEKGGLKKGRFGNFGYQKERNAVEHAFYLKKQKALLVPEEKCSLKNFKKLLRDLSKIAETLAVSFDMDSIHAASAPGVSAVNAKGFSSKEALAFVEAAAKNKKIKYFDVMETNPVFDPDGRTAKLAALLITHFILARKKS